MEKKEKGYKNIEPYSLQDIYEISNDFKDMMVYLTNSLNNWDKEIEIRDKACIDLMHFIEFNPKVTLTVKTEIWKKFYTIREERRFYKNLIQVINSYRTLITDKKRMNGFFSTVNNLNKEYKIVTGERKYVPRVLDNLFKEEEK